MNQNGDMSSIDTIPVQVAIPPSSDIGSDANDAGNGTSYKSLTQSPENNAILINKVENGSAKSSNPNDVAKGNTAEGDGDKSKKNDGVDKNRKKVSICQMFRYASWFDVLLVIIGSIMGIANGSINVLQVLILGDLFDAMNGVSGDTSAITANIMYFVYAAIATIVSAGLQVACFQIVAENVTCKLRQAYLSTILNQEIEFFDKSNPGVLASQVVENTNVFRLGIGDKVGSLFQFLSMFVTGFVVGFIQSYELALVILATTPLFAGCGVVFMKLFADATEQQLASYAQAGAVAEETFSQIRTVAALSLEKKRLAKYEEEIAKAAKVGIKQGLYQGFGLGLTLFVMFGAEGIGFYYGSVIISRDLTNAAKQYPPAQPPLVPEFCVVGSPIPQECTTQPVEGLTFESEADVCNCFSCQCGCYAPEMLDGTSGWKCRSGGKIVAAFLAIAIGAMAIGQAAPPITAFQSARAAAGAIYAVVDRESAISSSDSSLAPKSSKDALKKNFQLKDIDTDKAKGEICFHDVYFTYASRPDVPLFTGLNLTIPAGKTVALVGESGSGKSTIISLIERFYDPNAGKITIDGVDIRDFDPKWYRSLYGYVGQEPTLFATTIKRNIIFGVPDRDVSDEQIQKAAKSANAHDFIMTFPKNYDTIVGGGGSQLSGGQKQRIAIARALVRDPKVLLLDEATSALDNQSERIVQAAIDEMISREQRTTIIVAHRLSTVKNADIIVVLGKGKVIEQGNHNELMSKNGTYAALVNVANKSNNAKSATPSSESSSPIELSVADEKVSKEEGNIVSSSDNDTSIVLKVADTETNSAVKESETKAEDEKVNKKEENVSFFRAFQFARPERCLFIPALIFAAIGGAVFPVFGLLYSSMINAYFQINASTVIASGAFWAAMFAIIGAVAGLANLGQLYFFGIISAKMTSRVRYSTFKSVIKNEIGFFDMPENSVGGILATLATDATLVKTALLDKMGLVIGNTVTIIIGLIIAFIASWKISLVVLALFPLLVIGAGVEMMVAAGLQVDKKLLAESGQVLNESIVGIRTVTALGAKDRVVNLYTSYLEGPKRKEQIKGMMAGSVYGIGQSIPFFAYAIAFWYGATLIENGEITFGQLLQSFFGIVMMSAAIGQQSALSADVAKGGPALRSVFRFIDRKSKINPLEDNVGEKPSQLLGNIQFKDVSFVYPARPEVEVLKGFSLDIKHGETVALVGASGSGKSTIVLMIERFYDPASGEVLIDGKNSKDLNVEWLRSQLGYVGQEPQLFIGTIEENIRNGRSDATIEEVEAAAKASNAYDFIMGFPDKFQTQVGAKGTQLSGGQKQRIAIARAILRNPHILLLDEATSALDSESEAIVQAALDDLLAKQKRTTVIVAHRLSTVRNADKIVVLDKGIVVEMGTYNELLAKPNGAFSKLYAAQNKSHQ